MISRITVYSIIYIFIASFGSLYGQIPFKKSNETIDLDNFRGSKYINDDFVKSTVHDDLTKKDKELFLRYDAYNDVFQAKKSLTETNFEELKKSIEIRVTYNQHTFLYKNYTNIDGSNEWGYLQEICSINDMLFFLKQGKTLIMPVKAATTLEKDKPGKIKDKKYYVVGSKKDLTSTSISKKTILNYVPNEQVTSAKAFIKKSKLKFKETQDFIKLRDHLLQLNK